MFLFCFLLKFIENHKILDPRNAPEKNFETQEIPTRKKIGTHEIPTKENLRPTKYPKENILDPRNTHGNYIRSHEGTMAQCRETHETQHGTYSTEFSTLLLINPLSEN